MIKLKGKKLFSIKLWSILSSVFCALLFAIIVATTLAVNIGSAAINMLFGIETTKTIGVSEKSRFESDWADVNGEGLFIANKIKIREAATEGMVLLWNNKVDGENALPLAKNSKVSALSHSSVDIVESGTGSGHIDTVTQNGKPVKSTLYNALDRHYSVNQTLWDFYDYGAGSGFSRDKGSYQYSGQQSINEVPWDRYDSNVKNSFAEYGDAALVFISRTGGENGDLHGNIKENAAENGGYLGLTQNEKDLLENVRDYRLNGTFKRVILVFNAGNPMMMKDFAPYLSGVDAAIWMGQGGTTSVNALADLIAGDESFSGRLSDTLAYSLFAHPSTKNDGYHAYTNADEFKSQFGSAYQVNNGVEGHYVKNYMSYSEGIYIGYKYFETRYFDSVANPEYGASSAAGKVNSTGEGWNYNEEVAFPFGYGNSYSEFSYSNFTVAENEDKTGYTVKVTVTNVGDVAAKEVVQVYLSKPYTDYDKENDVEVAAVELVGFAKTSKLEAGELEQVTINVPKDYMKTYDRNYDNGDGTYGRYVLEAGEYTLTAATDSHVAANNILAKQGKTPVAQQVMGGDARNVQMGANFVWSAELAADTVTYATSRQTGEKIFNRFDQGDMNNYDNRGNNSVTFLSRKDWSGTYPVTASFELNKDMVDDLAVSLVSPTAVTPDNPMPTYGKFASGSTSGKPDVNKGDVVAFDFMDAPLNKYDSRWSDEWEDKWNQLLDQMTWEEQALISANAYHQLNGAESIALPSSRQENGPVGITKRGESNWQIPNTSVKDWTYACYPSAPLLGSTFNTQIVEEVGQYMSEDMLYLGYNGIYGPGGNLHRSPFGGRNWEYYSEDPVLAGLMGAAQSKGIENKGAIAYVKHFALNDMETNRHYCGIWSSEQATREVYLKAFEIIFTDGGASGTMNSFTRVGTRWNGACKEMQTDVLRTEWGWDGINITDWVQSQHMSKPDAILAGTNSFDGNGTPSWFSEYRNDPVFAEKLRESVKTIVYNVARTNTFNNVTRESIVIKVTPWWETGLYCLIGLFSVLTVGAAVMLTLSVISKKQQSVENAGAAEIPSDDKETK